MSNVMLGKYLPFFLLSPDMKKVKITVNTRCENAKKKKIRGRSRSSKIETYKCKSIARQLSNTEILWLLTKIVCNAIQVY